MGPGGRSVFPQVYVNNSSFFLMFYEGKRRGVCIRVFLMFKIYRMSEKAMIRYICALIDTSRLLDTHPYLSFEDNLL